MVMNESESTGLECVCDNCLEELLCQIRERQMCKELYLLAVEEQSRRLQEKEACFGADGFCQELTLSSVAAYARNADGIYERDTQLTAINELLNRLEDVIQILSRRSSTSHNRFS